MSTDLKVDVPQVPSIDDEYVIRFAYRAGKPNAPNLPIAFKRESWEMYQRAREKNPEVQKHIVTTTGQKLAVRRADCGAGCRCALEWRPV